MTLALLDFLNNSVDHELISIEQKFQEPGHSCVQEVDAIHSVIDSQFSKDELHSPLSVLRKLLNIRLRKPYIIYQMKKKDFKDFKSCSKLRDFKDIPYTKIKHIYKNNSSEIKYRTTLASEDFHKVCLVAPTLKTRKRNKLQNNKTQICPTIPDLKITPTFSKDKINAVKSLFPLFTS